MFFTAVIIFFVVLNALLALGVMQRNATSPIYRRFALFVVFADLWIISDHLRTIPSVIGPENVSFFARIDLAAALLTIFYWFRFVGIYMGCKLEGTKFRWVRGVIYSIVLFVVLLIIGTHEVVRDVIHVNGMVMLHHGPLFMFFVGVSAVLMVGGVVLLLIARRRATCSIQPYSVQHVNLILIGSAIALILSSGSNIHQVDFHRDVWSGAIEVVGMCLLVFTAAYSLVNGRFAEIKEIALKSFVFLLFGILMAIGSIFSIVFIAKVAFNVTSDPRTLSIGLLVATVVVLSFDVIRRKFEEVTDKVFFRGRYHPQDVLAQVTRAMVEELGLPLMIMRLVRIIEKEFRLEQASLFVFDENEKDVWFSRGFIEKVPEELLPLLRGNLLAPHMITDELPDGKDRELLVSYGISAMFLIRTTSNPVGLLLVGSRKSQVPLMTEDIEFLDLLAGEMAIGILNARLYTKITQFNAELEERVLERTTELKEAQEHELIKAQELMKLKDEFVFLAAHELRAPVTAIRSFIELSEDAMRSAPQELRENMLAIKASSEQLHQLINDLLEIARAEGEAAHLKSAPVELSQIVIAVYDALAAVARERHVQLWKVINDTPLVLGDDGKIREVIMNLVSNAIKYNREGGEVIVVIDLEPGTKDVRCQVKDTGMGIPQAQQEHIFEKFFRASTVETRDISGTGLGLFITRMLLEKMGGKISFTSEEGKGTTFTFTLPSAPVSLLPELPSQAAADV